MEKVTMKAYAVRHKLSLFNVMKMIKEGTLRSSVEIEGTREVTYVLMDNKIEEEVKKEIKPLVSKRTLEEEIATLKEEVAWLKKELSLLKEVQMPSSQTNHAEI